MSELKRFDIGYLGSEFESVRSYVDHGEYVDAGEAEDRIAEQEAQILVAKTNAEGWHQEWTGQTGKYLAANKLVKEQEAQIAALESRVEFLMEGHLLIKSQTPSADPTADHTIALGLGESIMEHHPVQHTEQGTALFVEVRVLNAVRPEVKRIDCEGVGDNDGFFEITPADTGDQE